jgi:hypothetical protein
MNPERAQHVAERGYLAPALRAWTGHHDVEAKRASGGGKEMLHPGLPGPGVRQSAGAEAGGIECRRYPARGEQPFPRL